MSSGSPRTKIGKSSELNNYRIKLAIPSHDRRLVHWPKWTRKHAPDVIERLLKCECGVSHRQQMQTTYCYFGTVPLAYFREVAPANAEERARAEVEVRTVA
jgi:hypothetical protein